MLCLKPWTGGVVPYGCNHCLPCRLSRQRLWAHRLMLENYCHAHSLFVTLTYDDLSMPNNSSLVPLHPKLWMKRYRRAIFPKLCRFYLVGEYGTKTERPHYHLALFNSGAEEIPIIQETWGKGFTYCGDLTAQSAAYICGYVLKKMTRFDDPRLDGRHPEFARMSLRPGIGAKAIETVGEYLFTKHGKQLINDLGDVPGQLTHGRKKLPIGRYLKQILRNYVGMPDGHRELSLYAYSLELSDLRLASKDRAFSFSQIVAKSNHTRILQLTHRHLLSQTHQEDKPI